MKRMKLAPFAVMIIAGCTGVSGSGGGAAVSVGGGASGSDMYYEYTTHTTSPRININGVSKLFVAADGKVRKETMMTNSAVADKGSPIITIGSADNPYESISIDDDAKTWSTNHLDSVGTGNDGVQITSTVARIGDENVAGFSCVHARVINHKVMGGLLTQDDTIEIWKSKAVPVPAVFEHAMEKISVGAGLIFAKDVPAQLKQMGCEGFLVKEQTTGKDVSVVVELTRAEKRDLPKSLFVVPPGYKEDKDGGL